MSQRPSYRYEFLYRPSQFLSEERLQRLSEELKGVASSCFFEIPDYQCLTNDPEGFSDKVLLLARDEQGELVGFCSSLLLSVSGVGTVLHLGLTCVKPGARGNGLTHKLTSKLVTRYLLTRRPFGKVWITNLACVLSSLGNVALHFEGVFPSPFGRMVPDREQELIAKTVSSRFRKELYIRDEAVFDPRFFVFKGSVKDTVFQKDRNDARFRHRSIRLNQFYSELMSFDEGDEILQVGTVSLMTGVKYAVNRIVRLPSLKMRQRWAWQS